MKSVLLLSLLLPMNLLAADYALAIRDHHFEPAELSVPAGEKIKLLIDNRDATPEEFDSHALNREKMIAANSRITLYVGPLEAGRYPFAGEFNAATAQGVIIAR